MTVTRCKQCGSEVVSDAASCPQCGSKDYAEASNVEVRREARSGRRLIWTVVAGAAIGAAIGAMFWYPFGLLVVGAAGGVAGLVWGTIVQGKET